MKELRWRKKNHYAKRKTPRLRTKEAHLRRRKKKQDNYFLQEPINEEAESYG